MHEKIDEHYFDCYNFPLFIRNITSYCLEKRRYTSKQSCNIYLGSLPFLSLERHWRPGEILPEFLFLQHQSSIIPNFNLSFQKYCQDPVAFLSEENNYFVHSMRDPWCLSHESIDQCLADFRQAYQRIYPSSTAEVFNLSSLEKDWKNSWRKKEAPAYEVFASSALSLSSSLPKILSHPSAYKSE